MAPVLAAGRCAAQYPETISLALLSSFATEQWNPPSLPTFDTNICCNFGWIPFSAVTNGYIPGVSFTLANKPRGTRVSLLTEAFSLLSRVRKCIFAKPTQISRWSGCLLIMLVTAGFAQLSSWLPGSFPHQRLTIMMWQTTWKSSLDLKETFPARKDLQCYSLNCHEENSQECILPFLCTWSVAFKWRSVCSFQGCLSQYRK